MIVNLFNKSEINAMLLYRICGFFGAGPYGHLKLFLHISCLWFSDYLLRRYGLPRPVMLSGVLFFSCFGCISVVYPYFNSVYVASLLASFTQGAQSELTKTILAEIFGLTRSSLLLHCVQLIISFGSFIMKTQLTR